jgi:hypothetical protein
VIITHHLLCAQSCHFLHIPFKPHQLEKQFSQYNQSKTAKNKKRQQKPQVTGNLWSQLWHAADSHGHTFIFQLFRKSLVAEDLINHLYTNLIKAGPIESLITTNDKLSECFAGPFTQKLHDYTYKDKDGTMGINTASIKLKTHHWQNTPATAIEDANYWTLISDVMHNLHVPKAQIDKITRKKTLNAAIQTIEHYGIRMMTHPAKRCSKQTEDGYGSESDTEETTTVQGQTFTLYSQKIICETCMAAIQLCYAAVYTYMQKDHPGFTLYFNAKSMYYETPTALRFYPLADVLKSKSKPKTPQKLRFFDRNHCDNKQQGPVHIADIELTKTIPCVVIDTTSATQKQMANVLTTLFSQHAHLETILLVSSGLKNEQAMADFNPYGTIRLFSKQSATLKAMVDIIKLSAKPQPKESHAARKHAKEAQFTPSNAGILNYLS